MIRPGLVPLALALGCLGLAGCGSSGGAHSHNAEEAKAVREAKALTPQQQLERAQANTSMPADQREALIKSIKEKHGLR